MPGPHPFFDDKRAVEWHTRYPDARAAATAAGKRIFLCLGGPRCAGTRALVEKSIAKAEIAEYLDAHFVALALDPAQPGPELEAIVAGLPRHEPTPVCVYLTADGRVVHSTVGGRPAAVLLNELLEGATRK